MKIAILALAFLLFPRFSAGECVSVPPAFQPSSQSVSVTALLDGKPVKGAKIDFFVYEPCDASPPRYSVVATIQQAEPAKYEIVATAQWGWTGGLLIKATEGQEKSQFALALRPDRNHAAIARASAASEKQSEMQFSKFSGLVRDRSGAAVGGAKITVWKLGEDHSGPGTETAADQTGRFSIALPEGRYVALFEESGFDLKVLVFEISHDAAPGDISTTLQVGWC